MEEHQSLFQKPASLLIFNHETPQLAMKHHTTIAAIACLLLASCSTTRNLQQASSAKSDSTSTTNSKTTKTTKTEKFKKPVLVPADSGKANIPTPLDQDTTARTFLVGPVWLTVQNKTDGTTEYNAKVPERTVDAPGTRTEISETTETTATVDVKKQEQANLSDKKESSAGLQSPWWLWLILAIGVMLTVWRALKK